MEKANYNALFNEQYAMRTPTVKIFCSAPGHFRAVTFSNPIHYLDPATRTYEPIDNSLVKTDSGLKNKANGDMAVVLQTARIIVKHPRGASLSWWIEGAEARTPEIQELKREEGTERMLSCLFSDPEDEADLSNEQKKVRDGYLQEAAAEFDRHRFGNLARFKENVKGTQPFATEFAYDVENRPTTLNYGSDRKTVYEYDAIGRILSKKVYISSNSYIKSEYTYFAGINGSSTNLVSQIVIKKSSGTQISKQVYDYDDLSRIKSVVETPGSAAGNKIEYFYDALGQLTRVNDPFDTAAGTTWVFSYDVGGNIVSKTAYPYTTGDPGSARKICTFTYGNSNWRDLLTGQSTAVNGVTSSTAITRDAIGNRLSDGICCGN